MHLNRPTLLAASGFCAVISGFLCSSFIFPKLENYLIAKQTAMEDGSKAFESWKKIPFPFKFKIYFFNVTNPDAVQTGSNPILKEIGPYIYDEFREREILSTDDENDTIRYVQRKIFRFNGEESGCRDQDDIVTILNIGVVSTANKINDLAPMALPMINDALPYLYPGIGNVFVTSTVRNILFDGMKMSCESDEVDMICQTLKSKLPPTVRVADNNRDYLVSLFHHINGTDDGPYEMERGLKGTIKGKLVSFKDRTKLAQWEGDDCNTIRGTDLTVNPNFLTIPKNLDFFASDFCRSFSVSFIEKIEHLGLQAYSFKSNKVFTNVETCFCTKDKCGPSGTMNLGSCVESPIILSEPHFLNADKTLLEYALGLVPDKTKHGTYIYMEPKTGLALVVKSRFQMNILLQKIEAVDLLQNVSEGIFPFIWLEEGSEIPQTIVEEIRSNFSKLVVFDVLKYLMIAVGVVLLGAALVLAMAKDRVFCFNQKGRNTISDSGISQAEKLRNLYPQLNAQNLAMTVAWQNNATKHH